MYVSNQEEEYHQTVAKPLKVIASFSDQGKIRPIYIEYDGFTVKVEEILRQRAMNDWGVKALEFVLSYTVGELRREVKIRYALETHIWYLPVRNL